MTPEEGFLGVSRSLRGLTWRARPADERLIAALAQQLQQPDIVARILAGRGIGLEEAERFLAPSLKQALPDPSVLTDMDRAVERLARALENGEQVAVFGDYDVDGATSSALLIRYFRKLGRDLQLYVPDRMLEGYGPNTGAMQRLRAQGVDLVVTVDCGIAAFEPLAAAREIGLEVIVVDHHQAQPALPEAAAVVNPNRLDDDSGLGTLAAVGVVFLLLIALNRRLRQSGWFAGEGSEPDLLRLLDLVALGTVCDVAPLTGLNRVLVAQGLKVIAARRNAGIAALADQARVKQRPGAGDLGFQLGPRVNAGGRVGRADLGARLLASDDPQEAAVLAEQLDGYNQERQAIEAEVLRQAQAQAEGQGGTDGPLILVGDEGWHAGVVGIVAGRLKDRYNRPTIVISYDGRLGKGSGRSVPGVDLGAAITAARQAGLLEGGGGHAMAAGLSLQRDRETALGEFLSARIAASLGETPGPGDLRLDGALAPGGATRSLCETIQAAGPFGVGHAEPRFALPDVTVAKADRVGTNHVRLFLRGRDGGRLKAIAFRVADEPLGQGLLRHEGRPLHVAGRLQPDDWAGGEAVQFLVEDAAWA